MPVKQQKREMTIEEHELLIEKFRHPIHGIPVIAVVDSLNTLGERAAKGSIKEADRVMGILENAIINYHDQSVRNVACSKLEMLSKHEKEEIAKKAAAAIGRLKINKMYPNYSKEE